MSQKEAKFYLMSLQKYIPSILQFNMSDRKTCLTSLLSFKFTNKFSGIGIKTSEKKKQISFKQNLIVKGVPNM